MSNQSLQDSTPIQDNYNSPQITIVITIVVLFFFFVGFFTLYFCRCFIQNLLYSWHIRHSPAGTPVNAAGPQNSAGIDPKIIDSFPTFTYSSVKDYRKEKYGLECAICLVEFGDDDVLRLLTSCCHVFHQECIDLWLEKHKTCPVCRRSLDTIIESPDKSPISFTNTMRLMESAGAGVDQQSERHSFCISIKDENEDERSRGNGSVERSISATAAAARRVEMLRADDKFPRSHSTGHSIVRSREEEDRFTLRLPEHVHARILRGHNCSKSCTTFGEFKSKGNEGNLGFGEVSGLSDVVIDKV